MKRNTGLASFSLAETDNKEEQDELVHLLRSAGASVFGWDRDGTFYIHPMLPHLIPPAFRSYADEWSELYYGKGWRTAMREDKSHRTPDTLFPELKRLQDAGYQAKIIEWYPLSSMKALYGLNYVIMAEGRYSDEFRDRETGKWKN